MYTSTDIQELNERIAQQSDFVQQIKAELGKAIVGQTYMVDRLLIGLLSNGHVLLEGVPGLAKTLTIKSLAQAVRLQFSRIQFTPDLLPADVLGTMIYNQAKAAFITRKGPIFGNFILADEINRAPAKVQSALLEAMQEKQVTIGEQTYALPNPFLVLATQNPLEQEGTYALPEAQVDRFMLKVVVGYPSKQEEKQIIRQQTADWQANAIQPVAHAFQITEAKQLVQQVYVDEKIEQYIVDLVFATRTPNQYGLGKMQNLISNPVSPRGSINLALAAKAHAYMQQRGFVIPEDIKAIAKDVLRHRIGLTYEAEAENIQADQLIDELLRVVQVP